MQDKVGESGRQLQLYPAARDRCRGRAGASDPVYELHHTFPNDQPNCEGLKRVDQWGRGYSDYIDRNGRSWGYSVTVFENGDKIFGEFSGTSQTIVAADGSKKSTFSGVVVYTGGTGRYQGVRGLERDSNQFDPEKNFNQAQSEAEYWLEK
jgi:hypothetical protein